MRLDKFLSNALCVSRKDVATYINKGRIKVNDNYIFKKDFHINEDVDKIYLDDKIIEYREFVYYMMNKPSGVVSAVVDKYDQTVVDLIKERKDVFPVGRLDKDTEGLLILTNNGKLAHALTSPKKEVLKKYYVELKEDIQDSDIISFKSGLMIYDGNNQLFQTKPALLEIISKNSCFVYLTEGKFHQVKRMFSNLNNEVVYLKRISMGSIHLDENLRQGEYRMLSDDEVIHLKNSCEF